MFNCSTHVQHVRELLRVTEDLTESYFRIKGKMAGQRTMKTIMMMQSMRVCGPTTRNCAKFKFAAAP